MSRFSELPIVPEPSAEILNKRQIVDYRSQREDCLEWLLTFGKNPAEADGYAFETVRNRAYRMDAFYRWVREQEASYTASITHAHGDNWLRHLARSDKSNAHKDNCRKAAQMLFKWRHHEHGMDEWEPAEQQVHRP
jgi:site-specific recombinase XerD